MRAAPTPKDLDSLVERLELALTQKLAGVDSYALLAGNATLVSWADPVLVIGRWPCNANPQPEDVFPSAAREEAQASVRISYIDVTGSKVTPRSDDQPYPETYITSDFELHERLFRRGFRERKSAHLLEATEMGPRLYEMLRAHKNLPCLSVHVGFSVTTQHASSRSISGGSVCLLTRFPDAPHLRSHNAHLIPK